MTVCGVTELDMTEQREREGIWCRVWETSQCEQTTESDVRGTRFNNKLRLLVQLLILLLRM